MPPIEHTFDLKVSSSSVREPWRNLVVLHVARREALRQSQSFRHHQDSCSTVLVMSDNWVEFFSVGAGETQSAQLIQDQVDWLLTREIIAAAENSDSFYGDYREGPRFAEAFDPDWVPTDAVAGGRHILFGVRVRIGWQISHNMDGFEGPPCPRCAVQLPTAEVGGQLLSQWYETRIEPTVTCAQCGHTDLLGNWPHVFAGYGNYASLAFVNGWPLTERFEHELLERIGHRSRVLYVHL